MDNLADTTPAIVPTFRNPTELSNTGDPRHTPFAVLGQNLASTAMLDYSHSTNTQNQQTFIVNPPVTTTISLLPPLPGSSILPTNSPPISTSTSTSHQGIPSHSPITRPPPPATRRTDPSNSSGAVNVTNPPLDVNFDGRNRWITQGRNANRNNGRPIRDESKSSQSRKRLSPPAHTLPKNKSLRSDSKKKKKKKKKKKYSALIPLLPRSSICLSRFLMMI
eukprot:TRINITY_DN2657_c0_g1_i3.p1 TRINITY_DN2657_c0_g1~~TRINITY_DN2657_c0_g1_i3.p1  ORF type:complete len:221 (-),score=16.05 TRINITY_DN2657_c0_g1_i3:18-680(-)